MLYILVTLCPQRTSLTHKCHLVLQHKQIAIFYGSQTGTAEEFAGHLAKDAMKYGMKASLFDPEEFEMVRNDFPVENRNHILGSVKIYQSQVLQGVVLINHFLDNILNIHVQCR
jgi:sulfite reductase alpha subunit-like flavoprotein